MTSTNFAVLAKGHAPRILQLAESAERLLAFDPNATLMKLHQISVNARRAPSRAGLTTEWGRDETFTAERQPAAFESPDITSHQLASERAS